MLELGSSLLGVGRDDDRVSPGFKQPSGTELFAGMVVTQDNSGGNEDGRQLQLCDGIVDPSSNLSFPLGLVIENTNPFKRPASDDSSAGVGHDIQDFAKGGLVSVWHRPGNFADVSDDFRNDTAFLRALNGGGTSSQNTSAPFIVADPWAVGTKVYCTSEGLLTTVIPPGASGVIVARIGYVRAVQGTGADIKFALELSLDEETKP